MHIIELTEEKQQQILNDLNSQYGSIFDTTLQKNIGSILYRAYKFKKLVLPNLEFDLETGLFYLKKCT